MSSQGSTVLGILELDEGLSPDDPAYLPREESLFHPATFNRPIITEMVESAFAEVVIRGDASLEGACVAAARRLVDRGADVITADCGFMIRHQAAISAAVDVPVVTSSLLLVHALLRQLAPAKKLAVITADSRHCTEDLLGIHQAFDRKRVVIGGIQDGIYVRNALARPLVRTDVEQIEQEVGGCIARLRIEHPEIALILFECTGFPVVTNTLRRKTGLPIYDITDLCKLTLSTVGIRG
ncbi:MULTISPECIES: hypothetical protein [Sinorhizobium]|uniref:Asp/Glu/hydantoin racemase n=1 Tax=Sinorhizobium americanum TaxID=194963 RepID=A0A2S3YNK8_9HYPH|nr:MULTISPECIES: hypothetical protein [Sinorhizobium]PDT33403.1 hypothetical protein CO656_28425 [Sinorhizobium sp. FG01]PDT47998.1 hypothetical protein CO664_29355 [Sinorhizobium sp. NG07B]POH29890.1 hypothetical protein ATY30_13970 [Sinorhizobium americanum]POH30608.1 hypothetical protein ATY31_14365 [Sinorhizobium americanum]